VELEIYSVTNTKFQNKKLKYWEYISEKHEAISYSSVLAVNCRNINWWNEIL